MSNINLSRLKITGYLDNQVPTVVIEEICRCYNIPYQTNSLCNEYYIRALICQINNTDVETISSPLKYNDYQHLINYINNDCNWTVNSLCEAFTFITQFMTNNENEPLNSQNPHRHCHILDEDYSIGPQTPSNPRSLNACVVYKICKIHNVTMSRNTTLKEMASTLSIIHSRTNYIREMLVNRLGQLTRNNLINLSMNIDTHINNISNRDNLICDNGDDDDDDVDVVNDDNEDSYNNMMETWTLLNDTSYLYKRILPRDKYESIVLAAINYKVDISDAISPQDEYKRLTMIPYTPLDPKILSKFKRDPDELNLNVTFNPRLPKEFYSKAALKLMAINEGYSNVDINGNDMYELLQTNYLSNNFYHGKLPHIINQTTNVLMETIDEISDNLVICYGIKDEHLTAFRYNELTQCFLSYRKFINPSLTDGSVFSEQSIRKLKLLCRKVRPSDTIESIEEKQALYRAIGAIELINQQNGELLYHLYKYYKEGNEKLRYDIEQALTHLLYVSMYMRGWDGSSSYPIESAPVDNQNLVDINVTDAINEFERKCTDLGEIGDLILNLPLLRYTGGEFTVSSDTNQGLTIKERLQIVKSGDEVDALYSCIRLSSNWFAASAYRFLDIIGITPPFCIERLRNIS